jgi:hypothetical protein
MSLLHPYTTLKGKHKGEVAFVVGAGTSLFGLNLTPIHKHVVISVNSSILAMPWQEGTLERRFWISNDALCRRWTYWSMVKSAKATRIVRNSWEKYYSEIPDFLYFCPRPTPEGIINPKDEGLAYCSSVPSGLDLALQMGCRTVFLLGVDHYATSGRTHFWQFWAKCDQPKMKGLQPSFISQRATFRYNDIAYEALNGFAKHLGVPVYNCNPLSLVRTFPRIVFPMAFDIIHNPKYLEGQ